MEQHRWNMYKITTHIHWEPQVVQRNKSHKTHAHFHRTDTYILKQIQTMQKTMQKIWIMWYILYYIVAIFMSSQIAKFMGPTWGPPGSWRPQMGPMLAPSTLLSGMLHGIAILCCNMLCCISLHSVPYRWVYWGKHDVPILLVGGNPIVYAIEVSLLYQPNDIIQVVTVLNLR